MSPCWAASPETAGLISGIAQLSTGTSASVIAASILGSAEIEIHLPSSLSNADFVSALYTKGLGRAPDSSELSTLSSQLDGALKTYVGGYANGIDSTTTDTAQLQMICGPCRSDQSAMQIYAYGCVKVQSKQQPMHLGGVRPDCAALARDALAPHGSCD